MAIRKPNENESIKDYDELQSDYVNDLENRIGNEINSHVNSEWIKVNFNQKFNDFAGGIRVSKNYMGMVSVEFGGTITSQDTGGAVVANIPNGYRPKGVVPIMLVNVSYGYYQHHSMSINSFGDIITGISAQFASGDSFYGVAYYYAT